MSLRVLQLTFLALTVVAGCEHFAAYPPAEQVEGGMIDGAVSDGGAPADGSSPLTDGQPRDATAPDGTVLTFLTERVYPDPDFTPRVETAGGYTAVSWHFGDGAIAVEEPNPSHTYTLAGTKTVHVVSPDGPTAIDLVRAGDDDLVGELRSIGLSQLTELSEIDLGNNARADGSGGLTGTIPTAFGDLLQLQVLVLENNNLSGVIPNEIGQLTNLTRLDLDDNQLSGPIPATFSNLTKLEILDLDTNQLTEEIPDLSPLVALTQLDLSENQLSGPIPDLSAAEGLTHLDLGNNEDDQGAGGLTSTIPDTLGTLSELEHLNLQNNDLDGTIPASLGDLTKLLTLHLDDNRLTGVVPVEICGLANLTLLDLDNNLIKHLPCAAGDLPSLTHLDLSHNPNLAVLAEFVVSLKNLQGLNLGYIDLAADISDLSPLSSTLQEVKAPHNQLTGTLPNSVVDLSGLRILDFHDNQISGYASGALAGLLALEEVDLAQNRLTSAAVREIIADIHQSRGQFVTQVVPILDLRGNPGDVDLGVVTCEQVADLVTDGWVVYVDGCP